MTVILDLLGSLDLLQNAIHVFIFYFLFFIFYFFIELYGVSRHFYFIFLFFIL
jgi:hypothetical protein